MWADQGMKQTVKWYLNMGSRRLGSKKKKKRKVNLNYRQKAALRFGGDHCCSSSSIFCKQNSQSSTTWCAGPINVNKHKVRQVHCPWTEDGWSLNVSWYQKVTHCEAAKTGLVSEIYQSFSKANFQNSQNIMNFHPIKELSTKLVKQHHFGSHSHPEQLQVFRNAALVHLQQPLPSSACTLFNESSFLKLHHRAG